MDNALRKRMLASVHLAHVTYTETPGAAPCGPNSLKTNCVFGHCMRTCNFPHALLSTQFDALLREDPDVGSPCAAGLCAELQPTNGYWKAHNIVYPED
jgi:hypothetical protein